MLDILWNKAKKIFEYPDEFIKIYIEGKENNDSELRYFKKELLDIETALSLKDKIINNWLRKQLEDDEHYDNYKIIIKQATDEKNELLQKRTKVEERLKSMKTIEDIRNMILKLSEIYMNRFWKFDKSEKAEYIKELVQRIDIFKEKYVINYNFNY